jgi:hypothetical protein
LRTSKLLELAKQKKVLIAHLIVIVVLPILYVQINKIIYANRVSDYLIEEKSKDYKIDDFKSIEGVWGKVLPRIYVKLFF